MFTAIYSLGKVVGAELLVAGVLLCAALYLGMGLLFPANRTKRGRRTLLLALLCAELLCDGLWFAFYFPGGHYHNYGIGGVFGAFLWPLLLLIAGGIAAAVNQSREEE